MSFGQSPFLHFMRQALANVDPTATATPTDAPPITPTVNYQPTPTATGTPADPYLGPAAQNRLTREQNINQLLALFQGGVEATRGNRADTGFDMHDYPEGTGDLSPTFLTDVLRPDLRWYGKHLPGLSLPLLFGGGDGTTASEKWWDAQNPDAERPRGQ